MRRKSYAGTPAHRRAGCEHSKSPAAAGRNEKSLLTNFARRAASRKLSELECDGVFASLSAHCDADCQQRREDALALLKLRKNQQYYLPIFVGHLK